MMMKEIGIGAAGVVLASTIMGTFMMYSDVQITKVKMDNIQKVMEERETTTKRFNDMIYQMDKTLTVQAQSVIALEGAVQRLEKFVMLAYKNEKRKYSEFSLGDEE